MSNRAHRRQSQKSTHSGISNKTVDIVTNAPVPPDGGWGWVVVACSFLISIIVDGVCYTPGVFFSHLKDYYQESNSATSAAGSVLNGTYLSVGVIVSALANKYGCRRVTMIGAVIAAVSFFLSSFSPNMGCVTLMYGFMGGVGFGLMYLPALVMVGYYFEERRAFATGIAVCGSGIGAFVFAPMVEYFISEYTWRGALWLIAAITLHGVVFGAFYQPLNPIITIVEPSDEEILLEAVKRPIVRNHHVQPAHHGSGSSRHSFEPKNQKSDIPQIVITSAESSELLNNVNHNDNNKIVKEHVGDSTNDFHMLPWNDAPSRERANTHDPGSVRYTNSHNNVGHGPTQKLLKVSDVYGMESRRRQNVNQENLLRLAKSQDSGFRHVKPDNAHTPAVHGFLDVARPLYRKDIFYSGSVYNLPQYMSHGSVNDYVKCVTRIPEEKNTCFSKCLKWMHMPKVARDILENMLDMSILTSFTFIVYAVANTLVMIGFFIPLLCITSVAKGLQIDHLKSAFLVSIIGITNTVGRVLTGLFCDRPWVDCIIVNNVTLMLAGTITMFVPLYTNYAALSAYCALYGLFVSPYVSLRTVIAVELLGLDKLSNAFGFITMFQGASTFIGVPIAGALKDSTGSFSTGFFLSGAVFILSGVMCCFLRRIKKWEEKRNAKHKTPETENCLAELEVKSPDV